MRVLAASCTSSEAYFTLVVDGDVDPSITDKVGRPAGLESGAALLELLEEVRRLVRAAAPDRLRILKPESHSGSYHRHVPRAAFETVILMAAAFEDVDGGAISRATVRSELGLPKTGSLDTHVAAVVSEPVGPYWNSGRGLAALAGLAGGG